MYLNLHFEKIKNPKDYHTMKMQFLSTEQLEQIHELTLDILENQGVWFKDSPEAKDIFKQNGCQVRDDQVFIPRKVFEECISRLPDRNELKICVTGLGMSESLNLGQGESHVGLIGNPYYIHEHGKGIRDLTETDTDDKFLIMDSLPNFKHDCCILINASQRAADSVFPDYSNTEVCLDYLKKRLLRRVRNGEKKPAMHSNISHGWEAVTRIHSPSILQPFDKMEVLRHAILNGPGESEALLSQDTPLIWCNPISPLQFHKEQVDEIIDSIKEYGPRCFIMFSPEVMLGGTGPVTMAGSLAQHNAEVMAGVVFTQLVAAGTPVIYGSVSGVMDLRSADISLGSMESIMFNSGIVQLADHYGIPNRIQTGNPSAREPGIRAAVETAWGLQVGIAAGGNLITTGLMDSSLLISLEHLVLIDEFVNQIRSASAASIVDAGHLARDVIMEEGRPSTRYMSHEHTLTYMKEAMYYSEFTGRMEESYRDWYELAHEKVSRILSSAGEDAAGDINLLQKYEAVGARLKEDDQTWREGREGWWQSYVQDLV